MNLRDKTCTTIGCTMPAEFCEAHHKTPWSQGGKTNLADGKLLCPFHHHRAHDPGWHHPPPPQRQNQLHQTAVTDRRLPRSPAAGR